MRTVRSSFAAVLCAVVLAAALASCTSGDDPEPARDQSYEATSLADFDASRVTLERTDFCGDLSDDAVEHTVGEVASTGHYGNGDPVRLTDGVKDISHEFNCTFTGESGVTARAWVFVPRVPAQRAEELVAAAGRTEGCSLVDGRGFGAPATGRFCRTDQGTGASYRGLFVDTWLTCSVSRPDQGTEQGEGATEPTQEDLLREAGEWCVAAAEAASSES